MGITANREAHIHRKALLDLSRGRPGLILAPFLAEIRTWRPRLDLYGTDGAAVARNAILLARLREPGGGLNFTRRRGENVHRGVLCNKNSLHGNFRNKAMTI